MIKIKNKTDCTGCYACYNICPKDCIEMKFDIEGFAYPYINTQECIKCNKCEKVCPIINPYNKRELSKRSVYAAINTQPNIRIKSSSGGVFYALAEDALKQDGIVYGASFNTHNWEVNHTEAKNIDELQHLIGSKYIQSKINHTYRTIKNNLNNGKKVVFCGTPCQVAGLNHFLNKKYPNLLVIELLCHGVPSYFVWKKTLDEVLKNNNITYSEIRNIYFRKKIPQKTEYKFCIVDKTNREYETFFYEFPFMKAFLSNLILRPSCYNCKAKKFETNSDLIIGDLWNNYNCHPFNNSNGTSIIIANTEKGESAIKSSSLISKRINNSYINKMNSGFTIHQFYNRKRTKFFKEIYDTSSILCLMEKYSRLSKIDKIIRKITKILLS